MVSSEQLRAVDTPGGSITYVLTRKKVKNLNLRVERDGRVLLSIPSRCPAARADDMVREKWAWILKAQAKQLDQISDLPPYLPGQSASPFFRRPLIGSGPWPPLWGWPDRS